MALAGGAQYQSGVRFAAAATCGTREPIASSTTQPGVGRSWGAGEFSRDEPGDRR